MDYKFDKIGSDAELFLTAPDGSPVPVCGLVGGTKENPLPVLSGNGFAVQEDNVMLEFNIPPSPDLQGFVNGMETMMTYLKKEMKKKQLDINAVSSLLFKQEDLTSTQAAQFGCDPDFCVWTRRVNDAPDRSLMKWNDFELRCSGFHIHASYTVNGELPTLTDVERYVKAQDLFISVPLAIHDISERRSFYGKAGAFRLKPYGHEYRVLGGGLLKYGAPMFSYIYERNLQAIEFLNKFNENQLEDFFANNRPQIVSVINGGEREPYRSAYMEQFKIPPAPAVIVKDERTDRELSRLKKTKRILKTPKSFISDPTFISGSELEQAVADVQTHATMQAAQFAQEFLSSTVHSPQVPLTNNPLIEGEVEDHIAKMEDD